MFQLIKGAFIEDISGLREEYEDDGDTVRANVSAENISKVFESFLNNMREDEPLFLFIEVPCSEEDELKLNPVQTGQENVIEKYHRDVYYLDGYYRENMLLFLNSGVGELLINDGFVYFGFGSMESNVELGKYEYNKLTGFQWGQDKRNLTRIFDELSISRVDKIVPALQLVYEDNPGRCSRYWVNDKDIYILIDQLKELGLYKAETREE